ncbi:MAG: peptide ABC transporter substrate-binding protein [Clostridia bacterium]|nr:peptide ABC transporter substrate-binding protein [Clostridia bacterium]
MKKFLALLLAVLMIAALAACGTSEPNKPDDGNKDSTNANDLVSKDFIDPIKDWKTYDEMIAQIKAETDFAKRTEMMHKAEDILMATNCVIPLYYYNDIYLQKDYVDGIYSNPYATKFLMYTTLGNGSDTLRINLASEPDFLDPALNSSVDGACLAANSFSGLFTYNKEGKPVPACAESYTVSDDGLVYTITLKQGLKWSDGSDLTANDFVYAWKRAVDPATAADYAYMFSGFKGYTDVEGETPDLAVSAPDATTLVFELTAPCAYMEDLMAFPTFYPVKQAAVEGYADWQTSPGGWCQEAGFVSNGAFVCTGWSHNTSMTYEKNPYWYDAENVKINKIEYMLSDDDTAIFAAYNAGNLDFADTVPTDEVKNLLDNPEFHIVDELGTYYVAFNAKSKIFEGKTPQEAACIREAFSIMIDRDFICKNIGQTGQIPANAFIPYGMADGNGGIFKSSATEQGYFDYMAINEKHEETVERARTLLKAAGYQFGDDGKLTADTPIQIEYLTNTASGHIAVAQAIQQDLSELGIELSITQQDWKVFLQERKAGNFDFAREGWIADFNDPINMLEMWTTVSGNNDCQFGR